MTDRPPPATTGDTSASQALPVLPFAGAMALGACLLFTSEPMMGKLVLPLLGGTPAVWNTCMLFFQAALLAGYAYAHFGLRLLGVRRHAALHAVLVLVTLSTLPPALQAVEPPTGTTPVPWLITILAASIGLPFFVLASTAPLVQRWFAETGHARAADPYFLYASSNLGSLAGLALYPFVIEPTLGLGMQTRTWAVAFVGFAVLLGWAASSLRRGLGPIGPVTPRASGGAAAPPLHGTGPLRWVFLAFVPSALLLTVTTYVTTDIAPVPLFWLVPLGVYLGTFVLAFGGEQRWFFRAAAWVHPFLLLGVAAWLVLDDHPGWALALHLAAYGVTAYVAHGQLARERPEPRRLTTFYLWLGVGGVLGGVFSAIVAPMLLSPRAEYLTLILLACLARPTRGRGAARSISRVALATGTLVTLVATLLARSVTPGGAWSVLSLTPPVLFLGVIVHQLRRRPALLAITVGAAIAAFAAIVPDPGRVILRERNFFGALTVENRGGLRTLMNGRTLHGVQYLDPARRREPTSYYSRGGPVGDLFDTWRRPLEGARVGAIGLGAGTLACYARPGQTWDFYEIDPAVVRLARDTTYFHFLADCAPDARIIVGDARLRLTRQRERYRLLLVDAFSSDAIPVHLITREAFELYRSHLTPDGILAVHITNRYLDLAPVIASHAASLGLRALIRRDEGGWEGVHYGSDWVVVGPAPALRALSRRESWTPLEPDPDFRGWTDDFSNVLSALVFLHGRQSPSTVSLARIDAR